jgi:DNA-binding XRE family transcriptional regulator
MRRSINGPADIESVQVDVGELRRRFCAMRSARRLSQADVAALLGVSQATISSFEHGRHALIRPGTLLALRAFVSDGVREEPQPYSPTVVRTVLQRTAEADCVWCGCSLPRMRSRVRFCPQCGGHQFLVCMCGARVFDRDARFCSACGKSLKGQPRGEKTGAD